MFRWQRYVLFLAGVAVLREGPAVSAFTGTSTSRTVTTIGNRKCVTPGRNNVDIGGRSREWVARPRSQIPSHVDAGTELSMISVDGGGSEVLTSAYMPSPSMLLAISGEWRQYVPLVVICLVLVDIVLGSPLANLALSPMRRAAEKAEDQQGRDGDDGGQAGSNFGLGKALNPNLGGGGDVLKNPKERVDTASIAQGTLDKARGTLELMEYLENNKSNEQLYEEARKKMDKQFEELDGKNS